MHVLGLGVMGCKVWLCSIYEYTWVCGMLRATGLRGTCMHDQAFAHHACSKRSK